MKKLATIAALITIIYIHSFSQIVFENGYFINESDQKINCLIRNVEWMNNPTSFQYKLSREDSVQKADTKTVKEFSIIGESKFIRATVKIDKSSNILEKLSSDRNPVFVEETLFLKLLVEGNASLDGSEYHSFDLTKGKSIFFGIGYKYKDKYSIEIQKGTNRDIMNYPSWDSKYSVLSLMIGYTLI